MRITDLTAAYSNEFPIYGAIADPTGLRLALRASSYGNLLDLSPAEHNLTLPSALRFSSQGIILSDGKAIMTDYPESDSSFTILAAAKLAIGNGSTYVGYLGGSFQGDTTYGGVGLHFRTDTNGTGGSTRVFYRLAMRQKNTTTGLYASQYTDVVLADNLQALPAELPWAYVYCKYDHVARTSKIGIMNFGVSASGATAAGYTADLASRGAVGADGAPLMHQIGDSPVGVGSTANDITLPHYMFYGRALTDAQIGAQYELDQKWLLAARGVTI